MVKLGPTAAVGGREMHIDGSLSGDIFFSIMIVVVVVCPPSPLLQDILPPGSLPPHPSPSDILLTARNNGCGIVATEAYLNAEEN